MSTVVPVTTSPCGLEYSVYSERLTLLLKTPFAIETSADYWSLQNAHQGIGERFP